MFRSSRQMGGRGLAYLLLIAPTPESDIFLSADACLRVARIQGEKKGNLQLGHCLLKDSLSILHPRGKSGGRAIAPRVRETLQGMAG